MSWQTFLLWATAAIPIMLTILPMWQTSKWWVRVWDYPRMQIAALLAGFAVIEMAAWRFATGSPWLLGVTLACLGWQVSRIWNYTPVASKQVQSAKGGPADRTIRLLIANVLQSSRQPELFLRQVESADPDVVLTVETDRWWQEQLAPLQERYPHKVLHPLDNTYGMLLFSKLELSEVRVQDRVTKDIPSIFAKVRLRSGQWIHLHCVHPEPPQVGNDVEERDAELLLVAREVAGDRHPTIVCGDLNDVAWSHTTRMFQRISGLLDPRVGRGLFPTFHAEHWFARWPLDHVFHDTSFRLLDLRVLDYFGSDHFPVLIHLLHDPEAEREQVAPQADDEEKEEAEEKIADGLQAAREEEEEKEAPTSSAGERHA